MIVAVGGQNNALRERTGYRVIDGTQSGTRIAQMPLWEGKPSFKMVNNRQRAYLRDEVGVNIKEPFVGGTKSVTHEKVERDLRLRGASGSGRRTSTSVQTVIFVTQGHQRPGRHQVECAAVPV